MSLGVCCLSPWGAPSRSQVIEEDANIADIHANSECFEAQSELSFKYLQVCFNS